MSAVLGKQRVLRAGQTLADRASESRLDSGAPSVGPSASPSDRPPSRPLLTVAHSPCMLGLGLRWEAPAAMGPACVRDAKWCRRLSNSPDFSYTLLPLFCACAAGLPLGMAFQCFLQ
jgi:hypothetical protein